MGGVVKCLPEIYGSRRKSLVRPDCVTLDPGGRTCSNYRVKYTLSLSLYNFPLWDKNFEVK